MFTKFCYKFYFSAGFIEGGGSDTCEVSYVCYAIWYPCVYYHYTC